MGAGVLGPVFRALDADQEHMVGIKLFRLDLTPEQALVVAEHLAHIAQHLPGHEGLVRPLAAGVEGTSAYFVTEYVGADSIDHRLRRRVPTPLDQVLPLIEQVAAALDAASSAGFHHGALHPRDVLVTTRGAACLTGVGVAQALEAAGFRPPFRRPYAAPERLAGRPWDARADVFTLAVLAVELATGRRPLMPENAASLQWVGLDDERRTAAVRAVLSRALDEDPARRDRSAVEWARRLTAAVRGTSLDGHDEEPRPEAARAEAPASSPRPDTSTAETTAPPPPVSATVPVQEHEAMVWPPEEAIGPDLRDDVFPPPPASAIEDLDLGIRAGDVEPRHLASGDAADLDVPIRPFEGERERDREEPSQVAADAAIAPDHEMRTTPAFDFDEEIRAADAEPVTPLAIDEHASAAALDVFPERPARIPEPVVVQPEHRVPSPGIDPAPGLQPPREDVGSPVVRRAPADDVALAEATGRIDDAEDEAVAVGAPLRRLPADTMDSGTGGPAPEPGVGLRMPPPLRQVDEPQHEDDARPRRFAWRAWLAALAACLLVGFLIGYLAGRRSESQARGPARASDIPLGSQGASSPNATASRAGPGSRQDTPDSRPIPPRQAAPVRPPPATGDARSTPEKNAPSRSSAPSTRAAGASAATSPGAKPNAPAPSRTASTDGRILVRSTPANAEVRVNGTMRGRTPLRLYSLEYGTYRIAVSAPGYVNADREVTISRANPSANITIELPREAVPGPAGMAGTASSATGGSQPSSPARSEQASRAPASAPVARTSSLQVLTEPVGARVFIDDHEVGTSNLRILGLSPGTHTVRIERAGFRPWTRTVTVTAGQLTRITASLDRAPDNE